MLSIYPGVRTNMNCNQHKGIKPRSMVDALLELCSPFLKGDNSAFIAAIASGIFFLKTNICDSNNYGPNGPNRKKLGSNY